MRLTAISPRLLLTGLAVLVLGALPLKAQDGESKLGTTITTLPCTISTPGVYIFAVEPSPSTLQSGALITIAADNVTLDLNGHTLSNTNTSNTAIGIYAYEHTNLLVHNGRIRGFYVGVELPSNANDGSVSYDNTIEDLVVSNASWIGIAVFGNDNVVRRCQVANSGGSTAGDSNGYGIIAQSGSGNRVLDNDVTDVKAGDGSHASYGVCLISAPESLVVSNRISHSQYGIYYDSGSSGKYRNNLVSSTVQYAFSGGTDASGNLFDSNGNNIDDLWEIRFFGDLVQCVPSADPDGDGLTNLQEYQQGTNPTDYYNGTVPALQVANGNNQYATRGTVLAQPLVVLVTNSGNTGPAVNAPVTFQVTGGNALVAATASGLWATSCAVRTDSAGHATVYCQLSSNPLDGILSIVQANAGNASPVSFTTVSLAPASIAAGLETTLIVDRSGTVWSWGYNAYGQLGNGRSENMSFASQVSGLNGMSIKAVAAGDFHSLALTSDGYVYAWGDNGYGQLGNNGSQSQSSTPVQVLTAGTGGGAPVALTGIVAIAAGQLHSLALRNDGTVWAWGCNTYGQLGISSQTYGTNPLAVQVPGLNGMMTAVTAGDSFSVVLRSDGTVWAWGLNQYGRLGNGTTTSSNVPTEMINAVGIVDISADADGTHTMLLRSDGTVLGVGTNFEGELGCGPNYSYSSSPLSVAGPGGTGTLGVNTAKVVAIAAGSNHSLVTLSDKTAYAWGSDTYGKLGNNDSTFTNQEYPVSVASPAGVGAFGGVTAIRAGSVHSVAAITYEGVPIFFAWGDNTYEECDAGYSLLDEVGTPPAYYIVPVIVSLPIDSDNDGLSDVTEYQIGSNPLNPDSNGDGIIDSLEYYAGYNPAAAGNGPLAASAAANVGANGLDYYPLPGSQPASFPSGPPVITLNSPFGVQLQN